MHHSTNTIKTAVSEEEILTPTPSPSPLLQTYDYLYSLPTDAAHELRERHASPALAVEMEHWRSTLPDALLTQFTSPRAIMFRQVATPNNEIIRFFEIAKELQLEPLVLEYTDDTFVSTGNQFKRALGKLPIFQYTGADGRDMHQYQSLVDFNAWVGKPLKSVKLHDGTSLVDFHHRLLADMVGKDAERYCFDLSPWFKQYDDGAAVYYQYFLSFFVRDGILFENFVTTPGELAFAESTVLPAYHAVETFYRQRPLISRVAPKEEEQRMFWNCYPKEAEQHITNHTLL